VDLSCNLVNVYTKVVNAKAKKSEVTSRSRRRRRRRRRSEMTSAGECLYARILYSKIKYKK